jgi:hypothetical protein
VLDGCARHPPPLALVALMLLNVIYPTLGLALGVAAGLLLIDSSGGGLLR